MLKIVLVILVLDVANLLLVYKHAQKNQLNPQEWSLLAFVLFVLVWLPLLRTPGGSEEIVASAAAPEEAAPAAPPLSLQPSAPSFQPPPVSAPVFTEGSPAPPPLTPLVAPESPLGVHMSDFRPKAEITEEEYARGRKKNLEVAPGAAVKVAVKTRKKRRTSSKLKVVDEDMVRCPNCARDTYPNWYGLCPNCGVRLK